MDKQTLSFDFVCPRTLQWNQTHSLVCLILHCWSESGKSSKSTNAHWELLQRIQSLSKCVICLVGSGSSMISCIQVRASTCVGIMAIALQQRLPLGTRLPLSWASLGESLLMKHRRPWGHLLSPASMWRWLHTSFLFETVSSIQGVLYLFPPADQSVYRINGPRTSTLLPFAMEDPYHEARFSKVRYTNMNHRWFYDKRWGILKLKLC